MVLHLEPRTIVNATLMILKEIKVVIVPSSLLGNKFQPAVLQQEMKEWLTFQPSQLDKYEDG